jgi:hypothetical protein
VEVSGQLHTLTTLLPGIKAPGTHWIGGCVSPRAVLDAVVKKKIPNPHWESNLRTPIVQSIAWQSYRLQKHMAIPYKINGKQQRH